ncbi:MAG: hypothetical protein HXS53_07220 [Theionarchaea archaeon]|nr:hypothetical protein [Theionarchaea archaeon]
MEISVAVPVYPTESPEKVKKALENVFPSLTFTLLEKGFTGTGQDIETLNKMKLLLENQRIRDTAQEILTRSVLSQTLTFSLNKQAAYMGKINFSDECPLDPIVVSITDEDIHSIITYLSGT